MILDTKKNVLIIVNRRFAEGMNEVNERIVKNDSV